MSDEATPPPLAISPPQWIDAAEINRALSLFLPVGQVTEIRVLGGCDRPDGKFKCVWSGYFDDHAKIPQALANLRGGWTGAYFILQPIDRELLGRANNRLVQKPANTTADTSILRRNWLLLDLDPVRPAGISSTDSEHEAARALAQEIWAVLAQEGFPEPVIASSGNGMHLEWRVDLEPDSPLPAQFLKIMHARFSNKNVHIDTGVANAARIWRLPGTVNAKGDNMPNRPHRVAQICHVPNQLVLLTQCALEEFCRKHATAQTPPDRRLPPSVSVMDREAPMSAYVRAALKNACAAIASAPVGERNSVIYKETAGIGSLIGGGALHVDAAKPALIDAAAACGEDIAKARKTIERALADGAKQPRGVPAPTPPATQRSPRREAPPAKAYSSEAQIPAAAPSTRPAVDRILPKLEEVQALWGSLCDFRHAPEVASHLRQLGIDPFALRPFDPQFCLARALPAEAAAATWLPSWAGNGAQTWWRSGHRFILPLWQPNPDRPSELAIVSLYACQIWPNQSVASALTPKGCTADGLVLATRADFLSDGESRKLLTICLTVADYIIWACRPATDRGALIGYLGIGTAPGVVALVPRDWKVAVFADGATEAQARAWQTEIERRGCRYVRCRPRRAA